MWYAANFAPPHYGYQSYRDNSNWKDPKTKEFATKQDEHYRNEVIPTSIEDYIRKAQSYPGHPKYKLPE